MDDTKNKDDNCKDRSSGPGVALKQAVDDVDVAAGGGGEQGSPAQRVLFVHLSIIMIKMINIMIKMVMIMMKMIK